MVNWVYQTDQAGEKRQQKEKDIIMARINVIIREIETNTVLSQMNNQEGIEITELTGEQYDKRVYDLLERTAHRVYGPNGMVVLTGYKAKGANAGFHALAGKKVRGRPHLFSDAKKVCITFELEGKAWHKPLFGKESEEQVPEITNGAGEPRT